MPLTLTKSQQAAANVLQSLKALRGAYESASRHLDSTIDGLISLDNTNLAEIGNAMGIDQMNELLSAHSQQVAGCNSLSQGTELIFAALTQSAPSNIRLANTDTLEQRLAAQYRSIVIDPNTGVFSVINLERPVDPPIEEPVEESIEDPVE